MNKGAYSIEDIFKAGWDARCQTVGGSPEEAWIEYRYNMLLQHEGVVAADEFRRGLERMSKPENVKCPDCGGKMIPRNSQYGKFWGCAAYPKCKGTRDSEGRSKKERAGEKDETPEDEIEREDLNQNTERSAFTFKKG